jgi:two-component system OmpR family response regulator
VQVHADFIWQRHHGSDGDEAHEKERSGVRILVVEDEARLAELLRRGLTEEGHGVDVAGSGEDALDWVAVAEYDALVLDVVLPGMTGLTLCRRLRAAGVRTPILLLTARDSIANRVEGLDAGADDYLVKPFAFAELTARLRALARRPADTHEPVLRAWQVQLDPAARRVWRDDDEIRLPNKEFRILEYLMRHQDRVLTRNMIAEHIWDYDFPGASNVIDVHVRQLRRKLDDPYPDGMIETVRGVGYRLRPDP